MQAQHRNADEYAEKRCHKAAHEHGEREARSHGQDVLHGDGEQAPCIRANGHEARMAERQLSKEADRQVQRHGEDDVDADGDEHRAHVARGMPGFHQDEYHRKQHAHNRKGDEVAGKRLHLFLDAFHFPHLTLSRSRACRAGPWALPSKR